MGQSVYFYNCLREIRQTVFGRDMRKPVADAIEAVRKNGNYENRTEWMEGLTERIENMPDRVITDVDVSGPQIVDYITVYETITVDGPDNIVNDSNDRFSVTSIDSEEYSVSDSGSSSAVSIGGNDYRWTILDSDLEIVNVQIEKTVSHLEPVYGNDYVLVFSING